MYFHDNKGCLCVYYTFQFYLLIADLELTGSLILGLSLPGRKNLLGKKFGKEWQPCQYLKTELT